MPVGTRIAVSFDADELAQSPECVLDNTEVIDRHNRVVTDDTGIPVVIVIGTPLSSSHAQNVLVRGARGVGRRVAGHGM